MPALDELLGCLRGLAVAEVAQADGAAGAAVVELLRSAAEDLEVAWQVDFAPRLSEWLAGRRLLPACTWEARLVSSWPRSEAGRGTPRTSSRPPSSRAPRAVTRRASCRQSHRRRHRHTWPVLAARRKPAARSSRSCTCRAPCTPPTCACPRRHAHVQPRRPWLLSLDRRKPRSLPWADTSPQSVE